MDEVLAWLGRAATWIAVLMIVPAAFVIVPWLMSAVGMMPQSAAGKAWEQAQPFALGYVLLWIGMGVLIGIGRSADARITKRQRAKGWHV
ncbi:hypothetical protein [Microbacterium sp. NPDC056057]|uniref:hypothetical protein n=1 Tax=Microbacterium sp. NPDC056057 TaxID=3345699 RepID=UPI0035D5A5EF